MGSNEISYQESRVPLSALRTTLSRNPIPDDVDHEAVVAHICGRLTNLDTSDFTTEAQWRDIVGLTGSIRTIQGPQNIVEVWTKLSSAQNATDFDPIAGSTSAIRFGSVAWIEARIDFRIPTKGSLPGRKCSGILRIVPNSSREWKIWIMVTILEQLDGCGSVDVLVQLSPEESLRQRAENGADSGVDLFDCVVAGGGQAGLCTAGRLKALGVSYAVLERNNEVGGNWLNRYQSFRLHTSKESSEMPFGRIFAKDEPYFLNGRRLAAGYKRYVERYGINIWLSTVLEKADWDESAQLWILDLQQKQSGHSTSDEAQQNFKRRQIRARHLVFAIGSGGQIPKVPFIPNREAFNGELLHSVDYSVATQWKAKRGVVIGSANSGQDVAMDMVAAGLSAVTVVQRTPTMILPLPTYKAIFDRVYNDQSDLNLSDKLFLSMPLNVEQAFAMEVVRQLADAMPEYWQALEKSSFVVNRYPDLIHILYERQGGHYFDVGAVKKIADGSIQTKLGSIESFTPTGLLFKDGSTLDADVIILATGFEGSMRAAATKIVGAEIGSRLDEYMGVDAEGELRGYAKPMAGQKNVWYIGSFIGLSRYYSRFLALQIKVDLQAQ
ncbi:uncharacterized protein A1O9_02555 [Exophiala aquamarina CBS 119918]|uniref:FAD/NAD(P)-binding domain-containing protein n=1 Tax=Exophiala aquamarina CBS 119918 TaxID=1182545 RepID=A0A072PM82_9EURO|nr:uncharacterized protein A1O9_02555 [Exophiala aquamarina CBS 119918]KEF60991.1 hypothetical protein A1O9_02555 [Exophiala aquamarina CBS 119918]